MDDHLRAEREAVGSEVPEIPTDDGEPSCLDAQEPARTSLPARCLLAGPGSAGPSPIGRRWAPHLIRAPPHTS